MFFASHVCHDALPRELGPGELVDYEDLVDGNVFLLLLPSLIAGAAHTTRQHTNTRDTRTTIKTQAPPPPPPLLPPTLLSYPRQKGGGHKTVSPPKPMKKKLRRERGGMMGGVLIISHAVSH